MLGIGDDFDKGRAKFVAHLFRISSFVESAMYIIETSCVRFPSAKYSHPNVRLFVSLSFAVTWRIPSRHSVHCDWPLFFRQLLSSCHECIMMCLLRELLGLPQWSVALLLCAVRLCSVAGAAFFRWSGVSPAAASSRICSQQ